MIAVLGCVVVAMVLYVFDGDDGVCLAFVVWFLCWVYMGMFCSVWALLH